MAQSVEKLPSESAPRIEAVSIPEKPEAGRSKLSQFFTNLAFAFPAKEAAADVREGFVFAAFALGNLVVTSIILGLPYFRQVKAPLTDFCIVLFGMVALLLGYYSQRANLHQSISDLKRGLITVSVCQSLAVVIAVCYLAFSLLFNFDFVRANGVVEGVIGLLFVLSAGRYIEMRLVNNLLANCGFELSRLQPRVRRLNSEMQPETVNFEEVKLGDILITEKDERVAFDGQVIDGVAQVMETARSAEGIAKLLKKGDQICAGSSILQGKLLYKVTAMEDEALISEFAEVINSRLLEKAPEKAQAFNSGQTLANLLCIFFAVTGGIYWIARFQNIDAAASVAISILLIGLSAKLLNLNFFMNLFAETAAFYRGIFFSKPQSELPVDSRPRLVIDYPLADMQREIKMKGFDLIDNRVEKQSLPSVLLGLAGYGTSPEARAITSHITETRLQVTLYEAEGFHELPHDQGDAALAGFYGKVGGVDFTVGSPGFLLERGVLIQPSEVENEALENEYFWYVALQSEVIARLTFVSEGRRDLTGALNKLKAEGFRATLCSRDNEKLIDEAGREMGFELAEIYGGLSDDSYNKKLESLKPFALFYLQKLPETLVQKAALTISRFDELRYDLKAADVIVFRPDIAKAIEGLLIPVKTRKIERQNTLLATSLSLMLLALSVLNLLSPLITVFAVFCASYATLMNTLRLRYLKPGA